MRFCFSRMRLRHLVRAGHVDRWGGDIGVVDVVLREALGEAFGAFAGAQVHLGLVEGPVVVDVLARVRGLAGDDRGERGLGDAVGFVEWLAATERRDQVGVLLDVGVAAALELGDAFARGVDEGGGAAHACEALSADDFFADVVVAAGDLPAVRVNRAAVAGHRDLEGEVVVAVAPLLAGALLASAVAVGLDRCDIAEGPEPDVDVVDVLLDDVVAREPGEVEPVTHLPVEVGPAVLSAAVPEAALLPEDLGADDFADRAIVDRGHRIDVALLVAALRATDHAKAVLKGDVAGFHDRSAAGGVDGDGLLEEDVLARVDRGLDHFALRTVKVEVVIQ